MSNEPLIEPAPHEFTAFYTYLKHDLQPFYAFVNAIKRYDGGTEDSVTIDGDEYAFSLSYEESGFERLNHPSCDLETIREYRINFHKRDEIRECGGYFHISPRAPKMETADGSEANVPSVTGTTVRVSSSNIPFEEYPSIFRKIVRQLGIDPTYFERPSPEYSTITEAEVYLRVDRDESGRIFAADGPLERIYQLLLNDRTGYRKRVSDDTKIAGYFQTTTIGPKRARELIERHELPKQIKHYYPKNPEAVPEESPLRHPKVGVSYKNSLSNDATSITALDQVQRELEEVLLNVLQWAGLSVVRSDCSVDDDEQTNPGPYIADAYFDPGFSRRQRRLISDPTPEIQVKQEHLVYGTLADGLAPSDKDLLDLLVSDGSEISPSEAAEETGYNLSTIYTAIDRLEHLVEHNYDSLTLKSHYVASEITRIVEAARERLEDATEVAARALANEMSMQRTNTALSQYIDENDIDINDLETGQPEIDVGQASRDEATAQFQDFVQYWVKGGWDIERLRNAKLRYTLDDGTPVVTRNPLATVVSPHSGNTILRS